MNESPQTPSESRAVWAKLFADPKQCKLYKIETPTLPQGERITPIPAEEGLWEEVTQSTHFPYTETTKNGNIFLDVEDDDGHLVLILDNSSWPLLRRIWFYTVNHPGGPLALDRSVDPPIVLISEQDRRPLADIISGKPGTKLKTTNPFFIDLRRSNLVGCTADLTPEEIKKIDKYIRTAVRRGIDSRLLSVTDKAHTQIFDDIRQRVLAKLVEDDALKIDGVVNTKAVFDLARRYTKDYTRGNERVAAVSQIDLPEVGDEVNDFQEANVERRMPWDRYEVTSDPGAGVWRALNWCEDDARIKALAALKTERPDDHAWLLQYVQGLRKSEKAASLKDRSRALNIRRWLERAAEK